MQAVGFVLYQIQSRKTSIYIYIQRASCVSQPDDISLSKKTKNENKKIRTLIKTLTIKHQNESMKHTKPTANQSNRKWG